MITLLQKIKRNEEIKNQLIVDQSFANEHTKRNSTAKTDATIWRVTFLMNFVPSRFAVCVCGVLNCEQLFDTAMNTNRTIFLALIVLI